MGYLNHLISQTSRHSVGSDSEDEESTSTKTVQCVCFDLKPEVIFIESLVDMAEQDIENTWYRPEEQDIVIQKAKAALEGRNPEDDIRGLEHCTPDGARRRKSEMSKAASAVIGEQLRQQAAIATENRSFPNGDELISVEYMRVSQHNLQRAYQIALDDEREVSGKVLRRPMLAMNKFVMSARSMMSSTRNLVAASS